MVLFDSHAWVWSVEGDTTRIGRRARRLVERASLHDELRVSPVTIFEVTALCAAGRLRLTQSVESWVDAALAMPGIRVAELTVRIAGDAGQIPRATLADPLDRLLVATACSLDATFLTADEPILAYALDTGRFRAVDARR
jgi:PIN domain nuclease of toxin-antitoxin system